MRHPKNKCLNYKVHAVTEEEKKQPANGKHKGVCWIFLKPGHMQRECPKKSTVTNVMYAKENGLPIAEFMLGGGVYKFLLDTGSQLSLCKESMLKHAGGNV